jgi:hypothetical protein
MLQCNSTQTLEYVCNISIKNTVFLNNSAQIEGGSIKWDFYEPLIASDVKFLNNKAGVYGDSIASVAKSIVLITRDQLKMKVN